MTTNIYMVRHAHSTYTPDELNRPLSAEGTKEAAKVSARLIDDNIEHVISSPYLRAIQTVEGLASALGQEIHIMDGFKERKLIEGGADNFEEAIQKVWAQPSFFWEGGESNVNAQERGVRALNNVLEKYENKNVAIGTHGNIMVLTMNYFDNQYDFEFWKNLAMPDIYKLSFEADQFVGCKRIWKDSY
ncbi:histidine phosphatase family protein [Halobacillus sp. B29]|uniref:histidine phosphatase family protein n=1 Tax=Halobacillus sp. B29 TaxID=3457432 RepID=UPI003FCE19C9